MKFRLFLAVIAVCSSFSVAEAEPSASKAHADHLLNATHSWNGVSYTPYTTSQPELSMIRLTIPAHTALPWHTHPFPNAGYVLQGSLTIQDKESGKSRTFHQGEAFAESVNDVHRGVAGDEPTVLLLTYAGAEGQPTSIPVDKQNPEY